MEVPHRLAHAGERLGVAVVVQTNGLATPGVIGAAVTALGLGSPGSVVTNLFD